MSTDFASLSTAEKYNKLLQVISSKRFLSMQGLGQEVPFFICPFRPAEAIEMSKLVDNLVTSLAGKNVQVLEINLYDLAVDLLKEEGDWEWLLENETTMSSDDLKEELQGILDIETVITPAITAKIQSHEHDVLILTGIGEVFPYIRSHNVLNNLQKAAKNKPTIMFFPGDFSHSLENGASLNLFSKFQDDRYYRAFDISQYEV